MLIADGVQSNPKSPDESGCGQSVNRIQRSPLYSSKDAIGTSVEQQRQLMMERFSNEKNSFSLS
jgi:hypothetical protein